MLYLQLAGGLVMLLAGGEGFVHGAVSVARRLGVSRLIVGLLLVGFGTSLPELVASLRSAIVGSPGIAIGNVVGSNIANVFLVLAAAAFVAPLACPSKAFSRDGPVLAAGTIALVLVCLSGTITRLVGLTFIVLLILYVGLIFWKERSKQDASAHMHAAEADSISPVGRSLWAGLLLSVAGLVAVLLGASMLVDAAITLAREWQLSEAVIGLTIVAIGTSLPELVIAIVAAYRNQAEVAFGDVVGSNIYNIFGIIGLTATVTPLQVPAEIIRLDLWVMLVGVGVLLVCGLSGRSVTRLQAGLMIGAYAGYLWILSPFGVAFL